MKYRNVLIIIVIIIGNYSITAQNIINIKWKDIKKVEGKIDLQRVKIWGEDPNNTDELFAEPISLVVDRQGNIYILDKSQCKIFIYDKEYKFIKTLGGKGSGPGEFLFPLAMCIDENDNLIVSDMLQRRLNVFDKNYKKGTIRIADPVPPKIFASGKKIYFHPMYPNLKTRPELYIYNYDGKKVGELGTIPAENIKKGSSYYDHVIIPIVDAKKNIYIGNAYLRPQLRCYSVDGKLNKIVNYELPYRPLEIKVTQRESINVWPILKSMAVDSEGRIFMVVQKRLLTDDEIKNNRGYRVGNTSKPNKVENTVDWYQLIVLDNNGNLLASKQLDQYASDLYIFNNCLYLIDGYYKSQIYQYKYDLK